jgi:hypothetical protein
VLIWSESHLRQTTPGRRSTLQPRQKYIQQGVPRGFDGKKTREAGQFLAWNCPSDRNSKTHTGFERGKMMGRGFNSAISLTTASLNRLAVAARPINAVGFTCWITSINDLICGPPGRRAKNVLCAASLSPRSAVTKPYSIQTKS